MKLVDLNVRQRLLLVALLPAALLAVAMAAYFTYAAILALDSELRQRGLAMVRYLAPVSEYGVLSGQAELLQAQAQAAARQPAVKAVIILGRDGRPLAVSGRVSLSADDLRLPLSEPAFLAQGERWLGFGAPVMRSIADVDDLFNQEATAGSSAKNEPIGKVFVEMDASEVYARQQVLLIRSLLIVLAGLGLASVFAVRVANRAVEPLNRLVDAVREMSSGSYGTRVAEATTGELGVLEKGFNEMAMHIEDAHREMQFRIEEATAQLAFQARHDALTNLINRREFESRLEQAIAAVHSGGVEVTVLFMDLDRFKNVNDTAGHLAGDELLRQVARLFIGRLREKDTLARIGGDEFAAILPDCAIENAKRVADDLCGLTAGYRFVWQGQVFGIGVSIGLVRVTAEMSTVADVLSAGDAACYVAKDGGRNRVHIHTSVSMPDLRQSNERWRERIERALHERRLRGDVSPIRTLTATHTGALGGRLLAEISLSLDERRGVPITGPVFRDMADRAGLAHLVDERAIEMALDALTMVGQGSPERMPILMVPLSIATIKSEESVSRLVSLVRRQEGDPRGLCVMLPEDAVIRHISEAGVLCAAFRNLGCRVALTDFGGWLASFHHLDVVCPDFIRINRGLTYDLGRHRGSKALVRAIRDISEDRGICTIAGEIEDSEALAALRELGIHFVQGPAIAPVEPLGIWIEGGVLRNS